MCNTCVYRDRCRYLYRMRYPCPYYVPQRPGSNTREKVASHV